jgi:LemA protein
MNKTVAVVLVVLGAVLLLGLILVGWGVSVYNRIITTEEAVKSAWSQVENQYQRRYDLVPNLVETVKGVAKQEQTVFENVTRARASVGQLTVTPDLLNNPQAMQRFQQAQDALGSALSRLLAVAENYPQLRSVEAFVALQSQLEGTENRISVERRRFNEAVQQYNLMIRRFPGSLIAGMMGFREKVYFESAAGAEQPPRVTF